MSNAQPVTDQQWDSEVLASDTPVLVDFWAEWCGPCRMVGPIVDEVAGEKQCQLKVLKLNVDAHPETARKYRVMSIPTLMVFSAGSERKRLVGVRGKCQLLAEAAPDAARALGARRLLALRGGALVPAHRRLAQHRAGQLVERAAEAVHQRPHVVDLVAVGDDPEVQMVEVAHHRDVEPDAVD